jgi:hypothetical protein
VSLAPVPVSENPVFPAAIALTIAPPPGPAFHYHPGALIERPPRFDLPSSPLRI